MAHGHVYLTNHAQLLARHLGQVDVRSPGKRVIGARRRAVGPVQPEVVHGTDPLQSRGRVRPVATVVRRTLVPVRVDVRTRRVHVGHRGQSAIPATTDHAHGRDGVVGNVNHDGRRRDGHRGRVRSPVQHNHASGAARAVRTARAVRAARAALPRRRVRPEIVHDRNFATHIAAVLFTMPDGQPPLAAKAFSHLIPENIMK